MTICNTVAKTCKALHGAVTSSVTVRNVTVGGTPIGNAGHAAATESVYLHTLVHPTIIQVTCVEEDNGSVLYINDVLDRRIESAIRYLIAQHTCTPPSYTGDLLSSILVEIYSTAIMTRYTGTQEPMPVPFFIPSSQLSC